MPHMHVSGIQRQIRHCEIHFTYLHLCDRQVILKPHRFCEVVPDKTIIVQILETFGQIGDPVYIGGDTTAFKHRF